MKVFLVNPSDVAFGTAVITPRWLFVLAAATPARFGDPVIVDETLASIDLSKVEPGDVVGIGVHTANVLRGMEVGRLAKERGAKIVYGGIHATLYPEELIDLGAADAVVKGDGDEIWARVLTDLEDGGQQKVYEGGRVEGGSLRAARWDLIPPDSYMWASVQTVRGCPKHCSFCSVWRTDGQKPRQRTVEVVIEEIVQLRRQGFRFIALADDNFYPVTLTDLQLAERQQNAARVAELTSLRAERFELMRRMEALPADMIFFTQITMEAAEDSDFLDAMRRARIKGALVGVEAVTEEGLKTVFKDFNLSGDSLVARLQNFKDHGVHVLGSFIFGLASDRADTFRATSELAQKAQVTFAQFVMMTPFPGTVDFQKWEKEQGDSVAKIDGVPLTRYWRIPGYKRPKLYMPHPTMSSEEIRQRTQMVWDDFYSLGKIWQRASCVKALKSKLAFVLISKLYRQMYANTGIAADSARRKSSNRWASWIAKPCRMLFLAKPMPNLQVPGAVPPRVTTLPILGQ
jgi:radical SAM superfamily enzyme YgiQ (UPF0313 family)